MIEKKVENCGLLICGINCFHAKGLVDSGKFFPCYAGRSDGIGAKYGKPCGYEFKVGQIEQGISSSLSVSPDQSNTLEAEHFYLEVSIEPDSSSGNPTPIIRSKQSPHKSTVESEKKLNSLGGDLSEAALKSGRLA